MHCNVAYLAQGKLRIKLGAEPPRTIESRFGQELRERLAQAAQRNRWKAGDGAGNPLERSMVWGKAAQAGGEVPLFLKGLTRGPAPGQLLYALQTDAQCAVLRVDGFGDDELRLWNHQSTRLEHLCLNSATGDVACSVLDRRGAANLGIMSAGTGGLREVTEGDSFDTAPAWAPGTEATLLFQSAGIGRTHGGHFAALGPFHIQELDLTTGEMTTLAESGTHDLLTPKKDAAGNLLYIRRPYRPGNQLSFVQTVKAVVLFPVRFVVGVVGFMNVFSQFFTPRHLAKPGGPKGAEVQQMSVWGHLARAPRRSAAEDAPDLVPRSWELVRRAADGGESVIARGVLAFDIGPDGTLVYTNGNRIELRRTDGTTTRVLKESFIEQVIALPA